MSNVNSIELKFDINGKEYVVPGCHRSPSDNIDAFLYTLNNHLTQSSDFKNQEDKIFMFTSSNYYTILLY